MTAPKKKVRRRRSKRPKLPEAIGKYVITRLIGEGGMGRVYRGIDPDTRAVVAVKTILEARLESASALPRFLREMQILTGLDHPSIVKIRDRGMVDDGHFLVMDFVEGRPLDKVIRKGPRPGRDEALQVADQIADALGYLHEKGVMHRDLKPGNIMLRPGGGVTLVDFGLSRFLDGGGTVTGEGRVIGSPHYLPPEQWRGDKPDQRADVYQLGVLTIELLTGKVPFSGTDLRAIMDSCLNYGISRRLLASLGIEGDLAVFLRRCTRRDAARRYQTMAELRTELGMVRRGEALPVARRGPVPAPPPPPAAASEDEIDLDAPTVAELAPVPGARAISVRQPVARRRRRKAPREGPARPPRRRDPPAREAAVAPAAAPGSGETSLSASSPRNLARKPLGRGPADPDGGSHGVTIGQLAAARPQAKIRRAAAEPSAARRVPVAAFLSAGGAVAMAALLVVYLTRPPPPPPAPKVVSGPTVRTSLAVARVEWETDRPSIGALEVRGGGTKKTLQSRFGAGREHQILLEDLIPGKAYTVRVMGKTGPLGEEVSFQARGPSISFDPIFTPAGLEVYWRSEDPLMIGPEAMGRSARPEGQPSNRGKLTMPGFVPGKDRVTVLAFSPLGSAMPVAFTVPAVDAMARRSEETFDDLLTARLAAEVEEALAPGGGRAVRAQRIGRKIHERLREIAAPFDAAAILHEVSVVLDAPGTEPARRDALLRSVQALRRITKRIDLAGGESAIPMQALQGETFRWGARPGGDSDGVVLAVYDPPPRPLVVGAPAGGDRMKFRYRLAAPPSGRVVTVVVRAVSVSLALFLQLRGPRVPGLLMFTSTDAYRSESALDAGDRGATLYHSLDASMLGLEGELEIALGSVIDDRVGRSVSLRRVEIIDGHLPGTR